MLACASAVCALLIGYQVTVILLQPPWIKPATDWLRTALAWPQFAVVAWVAVRLLRTQRTLALVWCLGAGGLLSYAVARTTWTIADIALFPRGVPFPSFPDLFFILQYPCFAIALFLAPAERRGLPGLRLLLDGVLWMSAVTALSWYFVLLPLSRNTSEASLSRDISMYYQVFDLLLFYGLVMALVRPRPTSTGRLVMLLLSVAVISVFVADSWATLLLLHPPYTYRTGSAPDLFWFTFYLLIPLAALVRLRLAPAELAPSSLVSAEPAPRPPASAVRLAWSDLVAALQFVAPSMVAVGAAVVIFVHTELTSPYKPGSSAPEAVVVALLLLATLRPAVAYLEHEHLRRERDAALAKESALRLANVRMEAFLNMVAHELKTPLASLMGYSQLISRRLETLLRLVHNHDDYTDAARMLHALIDWYDQSLERMERLVEDVLDETRVQQGRLTVRLEPRHLTEVVAEAVAEQRQLHPERTIRWIAEESPVPVMVDANRIEQVVTNFVSNALKFSRADQAVEVHLQTADGLTCVSVHDDGVGIPLPEQPHVWEPFYQAAGARWQSGSQVGFGLGLAISKAIVEGHHGQAGIESAPGQGTTAWFTLPLATSPPACIAPQAGPEHPPAAPPRSDDRERTDEQRTW
jgi:signal transduction histidine kinase